MRDAQPKSADIVLSGGGVKSIGLVGAVVALMDAGYSIKRVSGVSAGSLVGSILAAASNGDQPEGNDHSSNSDGTVDGQPDRGTPSG